MMKILDDIRTIRYEFEVIERGLTRRGLYGGVEYKTVNSDQVLYTNGILVYYLQHHNSSGYNNRTLEMRYPYIEVDDLLYLESEDYRFQANLMMNEEDLLFNIKMSLFRNMLPDYSGLSLYRLPLSLRGSPLDRRISIYREFNL